MTYIMMTGFYLLLAILLEVAGVTSMKFADGFNHLGPSILIFVFYSFSFAFLALTLKRLELSFAYAVWSGLGTLLIAIIGVFFFHEPMTLIKGLSLGLIIIGVMGLRLG
jgi:small multidrug resistance pump